MITALRNLKKKSESKSHRKFIQSETGKIWKNPDKERIRNQMKSACHSNVIC
jgi:hypothetical protein